MTKWFNTQGQYHKLVYIWEWMVKGSNRLSPAAAMSLNRGCEERPSRRKEGWEVGTEGAGAGAGPPGNRGEQHTGVSIHSFISKPEYVTAEQEQV